MKKILNIKYLPLFILLTFFSPAVFYSCTDDSVGENFYTFTGQTVTDFLEDDSEKFSDFIHVLKKAEMWGLLQTYGSFTCFATTNGAFEDYLTQKGKSSIEMLSKLECDTIAQTHVIKTAAYFTTDVTEGTLPGQNMLDRYLTLSCDSDVYNNNNLIYFINKNAQMVQYDDSVENGVVHVLNNVILSSSSFLPDLLAEDQNIQLFYKALVETGMRDSMMIYLDENYSCGEDSIVDGILYETGDRQDIGYYPAQRKFMFTAFIEPDSIYNKYGIYDFDDLVAYAESVYGKGPSDYTDRKNALNRFVSYHLLDRYGSYSSLNCSDAEILNCFIDTEVPDVNHDFYETMHPYTLMKISSPKGVGMFINRKYRKRRLMIEGIRIFNPSEMSGIEQDAVNGIYHYIDNILVYDDQTKNDVLNTRFRIDATTLTPDFMNTGARGWKPAREYISYAFKPGFVKNFKYDSNTFFSCRQRYIWFASYMGDNCTVLGNFDIKFKIPPVPEGTYEIRLGYTAMACRGVIQIYFDSGSGDIPCDIPLDMRSTAEAGWEPDTDDAEYNTLIDKAMHNRGFMKGPASYQQGATYPFRTLGNICRRVLATEKLRNDQDYYIRIRQVLDNDKAELSFDYIELCPKDIYGSAEGEDIY